VGYLKEGRTGRQREGSTPKGGKMAPEAHGISFFLKKLKNIIGQSPRGLKARTKNENFGERPYRLPLCPQKKSVSASANMGNPKR